MSNSDWDAVRRSVRNLENDLDQKISSYSKLANQLSTAYYSSQSSSSLTSSREDARKLELDISESLDKLGKLVDEMATLLDNREILSDYQRDFKRTQNQIKESEQRQNLLGSVREEISAFNSSSGQDPSDALLNERSRIDSSHRMADDVLEQAYATRYEFSQQRGAIGAINTRMKSVMTQVPGINSLLSMINSRRRKETVILSSVTGLCTLILLWYVWG